MALRAVPEHPKFARLKRTLKVPKWGALGLLESLWHFTGKFTPHGDLGKYPDAEIEAWLEWEGEPGALISALITCGWIDEDKDHRLLVHDWHQHADDATKLAVKRSKRTFVVLTVSRQRRDVEGESDARTRVPEPEPVSKPEPVSEPDHLALTRVSFPSVEVFLTIPLNDKSEFAVTEAKVREWKELYSAIDVRDEIRAYKGWALNNPAKRKTRKGILASLNGWLARRHDKGRSYQNGGNNAANRSQTRTNSNIEALNRSFAEDSIRTRALAEARQASISAETCQVYSEALLQYDILDVTSAINALAVEPKADFETSFPSLGTLVERTKLAWKQRIRSMSKPCTLCVDGWIVVDRLSSNPRSIACQCRRKYEALKEQLGESARL